MTLQLIIRPEAHTDLADARDWYGLQQAGLGQEFVEAIDRQLATILRQPLIYPVVYRGRRRALVRRFPYAIIFRVTDTALVILAVMHTKRNPPTLA